MHFAERVVAPVRGGELQLKRILGRIKADYDFVLVDCPPTNNIVTENALLACHHVLIPARMHPDSQRSIATLIGQMDSLAELYGVTVNILGILLVASSPNTEQKRILELLQGHDLSQLAPILRLRKDLIDSARYTGHSIFSYTPDTKHREKAQLDSKEDYLALANFVLEKTTEATGNIENTMPQKVHAEAPVDQQQAGALLAECSDTRLRHIVGPDAPPRVSMSFRLQEHVKRAIERKYLDLRQAGVPVRLADIREGLLMIGLKYSDELDERYLGRPKP